MPIEFFERLRWAGRLFLLLFILGAAAFLSAITAMRFAIEGRIVNMPNLVGQNVAQAQAALAKRNLGLVVADHVYSDLPADDIVRQSPSPETRVKVGQRAQVVLSLGQQRSDVPNLIDRSLPVARIQLINSGLQIGEVSYLYSSGEPANLILQQDPLPGEAGLGSPRVSVLVSLGPEPSAYLMPDFTGLLVTQVSERLMTAGLGQPSVMLVPSPGSLIGSVVAQNPPAGTRIGSSTPVTLSVASTSLPPTSPGATPGQGSNGGYAKMPNGGR